MKVTHSTLGDDGLVEENPRALASQAGTDLETYTLARVMASEKSSGPRIEKIAIGWATWNRAKGAGWSVFDRLTFEGGVGVTGRYGRQNRAAYGGGSRYASTSLDPDEEDIEIAKAILQGRIADPTYGATGFFEPVLQDQLVREGFPGYRTTSAEFIENRIGEGNEVVLVPGVQDTMFFRKIGPHIVGLTKKGYLAVGGVVFVLAGLGALGWSMRSDLKRALASVTR